MPWDASTFAKHNHSLHGAKAGHAAKIANAVLKRSGDEGMAIATANKWASKRAEGGLLPSNDYLARHRQAQQLRAADTDAGRMEKAPPDRGDWQMDMPLRSMPADRSDPWWSPEMRSGGIVRRDAGGPMPDYSGGIAGPTPTAANQNPLMQGAIQRYSNLPTEQLAELAARLGGTQQGQMIQQLLMKRRLMPPTAPPPQQPQQGQQQPANPLVPPTQPLRKGGKVKKRDGGGGLSLGEMSPWWTRREATGGDSGFLHGSTPGRADQVKTQAPAGAYIIPADVVAGEGEGNSLAGAKAIQEAISTGPWGTPLPRMRGRSTIPHPPPLPSNERTFKAGGEVPIFEAKERSKGGANNGATPVDLSDGEFCVSPKDCERFGNGNREAGHRWWDDWVVRKRKEHINKLRKLPGPVKE